MAISAAAGLAHQGELNVDVLDSDATTKLADWFEDRWRDRWCLDISKELAEIIDQSWAGETLVPPFTDSDNQRVNNSKYLIFAKIKVELRKLG